MKNDTYFSIGEPVAICTFTNLTSFKIAQVEKTFYYNEKVYLPCRILRLDDNHIKIPKDSEYVLIVTTFGFVISVEKKYLYKEPHGIIDAVLKEQEYVLISQNVPPYEGKLVKIDDENWFIPKKI